MNTTILNNRESEKGLLKALIVDADSSDRNALEILITSYNFIRIEGRASSLDSIIPIMLSKNIDFVFLNVAMPEITEFDAVENLSVFNIHPKIIFITAIQKNAINAMKGGAFDFLLKPFDKNEVHKLMMRLSKVQTNKEYTSSKTQRFSNLLNNHNRIRFNTRNGFLILDISDIQYIKAEWNYTTVYLRNYRTELLSINLGNIEKTLPYPKFFRINRSAIINIDYLSKVDRKTKTCVLIVNSETLSFEISTNRLKELCNIL